MVTLEDCLSLFFTPDDLVGMSTSNTHLSVWNLDQC